MRAIVLDRHGGPQVLRVRDLPNSLPGVGEVRVRVDVRERELDDYECARWGCRWSKIAGQPVRLTRALIRRGYQSFGSPHPWPSTISPVANSRRRPGARTRASA
jgi:hypothetical protein